MSNAKYRDDWQRIQLKESLIKNLIKGGVLRGNVKIKKVQIESKFTRCCTFCGRCLDSCVCMHNNILSIIDETFKTRF